MLLIALLARAFSLAKRAISNMEKLDRNCRVLPEPSTLTMYWSLSLTSTTTPVMSHLEGWLPTWFWTRTESPTASLGRTRQFLSSFSMLLIALLARAFSLSSLSMIHSGWGLYLVWGDGRKSLRFLPKMTWAGL